MCSIEIINILIISSYQNAKFLVKTLVTRCSRFHITPIGEEGLDYIKLLNGKDFC